MANEWTGVSSATDDGAGFRAATNDAVEQYKADPETDGPARLKVVDMYVEVRNPIHEYIVVLGPHG